MSILNQTNDGRYNVLFVLYKYLRTQGATSRKELVQLCSATSDPGTNESTLSAHKTLNKWKKIGIFSESEDNTVSVPDTRTNASITDFELHNKLRNAILAKVFRPKNNNDLWDPDENAKTGASDFSVAVSWMLAQPFHKIPHTWNTADQLQQEQFPQRVHDDGKKAIQNSTRWDPLKRWTRALGFGYYDYGVGNNLAMDPTIVLRASLEKIFAAENEMTTDAFHKKMGEVLPVLDGGTYRQEVEKQLAKTPSKWQPPAERHFSQTLSVALRRLENEKKVDLHDFADAPEGKWTLTDLQGNGSNSYSHIKMN